ncbi:MAG: hypothetical protein LIO76_11545 [Clostridiales bacterium]|nr:hypothetical protein [Clostridiales bacterium]
MRDEWSGFADLLANLIAKYASEIGIDALPDPEEGLGICDKTKERKNNADSKRAVVAKDKAA